MNRDRTSWLRTTVIAAGLACLMGQAVAAQPVSPPPPPPPPPPRPVSQIVAPADEAHLFTVLSCTRVGTRMVC